METHKSYLCVLTGGPCGGKTSSLNHLKQVLTDKGFAVFSVPEAATFLSSCGANFPGVEDLKKLQTFEEILMRMQIGLEDSILALSANQDKPAVILCDRGLMDVKAYVTPELWHKLLEGLKVTEEALLHRYDIVCHLVTAALDAEDFYTTSNNQARRESPQEARALDQKTYDCWAQHGALFRIGNEGGSFQKKLDRLTESVLSQLEHLEAGSHK